MKILITGHKGFVGRHLTAALKTEHEVTGFDCGNDPAKSGDFVSLDCEPELVIHCGGVNEGRHLFNLNYFGTCQITNYCRDISAKLIFFSSASAIEPSNQYGWSKNCAEFFITCLSPKYAIVRPFNVWSLNESPPKSIIGKLINKSLAQVYKGCIRDFIHIDDIVDAICQIVNENISGIFELGTAQPTEVETFAQILYGGTDIYLPSVVDPPPDFQKELIATESNLLPNWNPTPLSEHFELLRKAI